MTGNDLEVEVVGADGGRVGGGGGGGGGMDAGKDEGIGEVRVLESVSKVC